MCSTFSARSDWPTFVKGKFGCRNPHPGGIKNLLPFLKSAIQKTSPLVRHSMLSPVESILLLPKRKSRLPKHRSRGRIGSLTEYSNSVIHRGHFRYFVRFSELKKFFPFERVQFGMLDPNRSWIENRNRRPQKPYFDPLFNFSSKVKQKMCSAESNG